MTEMEGVQVKGGGVLKHLLPIYRCRQRRQRKAF